MAKLNQEEQDFITSRLDVIRKANEAIVKNTASIFDASSDKDKANKDLSDLYNRVSYKYVKGRACEINIETMEVVEVSKGKDAAE
jgi:hypothetical protein